MPSPRSKAPEVRDGDVTCNGASDRRSVSVRTPVPLGCTVRVVERDDRTVAVIDGDSVPYRLPADRDARAVGIALHNPLGVRRGRHTKRDGNGGHTGATKLRAWLSLPLIDA
jgi:hypothetical protein